MSETELPPKYYHENFEYLLNFVKEKYKEILKVNEWSFLRKYYSLPEDAQCLFIRFLNRKGLFFKTENLSYNEIEHIPENLKILAEREFISFLNPDLHKNWVTENLAILTKREVIEIFGVHHLKAAKKEQIMDFVLNDFSSREIIAAIAEQLPIIKVNFESEVSFLLFLFFGNRSMDMTEFVLRDLGLMQYFRTEDDNLVARFSSRKEAEDKWLISDQFLAFNELKDQLPTPALFDWYCNFRDLHTDLSEIAIPAYQKFQLLVGKHLEKSKEYDLAVEVYKDTGIPPSRERMARCLAKNKNIEEAKAVCLQMIDTPINVDETYFAEFFLSTLQGKKSRKKTTEALQHVEEIYLPSIYVHNVELGSMEYFQDLGYSAGFSENFTWRALFGLTFWDLIFDPDLMAFHHPFQRRPSDLYLPDFYLKRENAIKDRLSNWQDGDEYLSYLWENYQKYEGIANPFVLWNPEIWEMVKVASTRIPLEAIQAVLLLMAQQLVENSRGFPDLLVWDQIGYEFIEIKSPNDALSNQQLFWLRTFEDLGVKSRILRVRFLNEPKK